MKMKWMAVLMLGSLSVCTTLAVADGLEPAAAQGPISPQRMKAQPKAKRPRIQAVPTAEPVPSEAPQAALSEASEPAPAETVSHRPYITDGGNPPTGVIMLSPMIGHYALTGMEYGVKGAVRVVPHGFISALNNSISAEVSVFRGEWKGVGIFVPDWVEKELYLAGVGRWDFHVHRVWTVYGAAGLGYNRTLNYKELGRSSSEASTLGATLQVGGIANVSEVLSIRAEYDTMRSGLRIGVALRL